MAYSYRRNGDQTRQARNADKFTPTATLRRLEHDRELWMTLLDKALAENNVSEVEKLERCILRNQAAIDYQMILIEEQARKAVAA